MTIAVYTRKPYSEYVAVSIDVGMHGDIDANDLSQVRKAIAEHWGERKDLIRIGRAYPLYRFNLGYVGFDRSKGLFYWIDPEGVCKVFNPANGRLGPMMRIPPADRKLIWKQET